MKKKNSKKTEKSEISELLLNATMKRHPLTCRCELALSNARDQIGLEHPKWRNLALRNFIMSRLMSMIECIVIDE